MSESVFRWCFIGCGTLARNVAKQIKTSGRHQIVTAYARTYEHCARFAEAVGARPCTSAEDAIRDPNVDGVYIVTPHTSHAAYTKMALEFGKPVLCEKPFTVAAKETAELIELARSRKLYLAEAMWTWFAPVANQVKQWLDDGEFGQLRQVKLDCHCYSVAYASRVTDPMLAGGALLDMGVYALTYLYRLFGKPDEVRCTGVLDKGIDWEDEVTFLYRDGRSYHTSISIRDLLGFERLVLDGSRARVCVWPFHYANRAKLIRRGGPNELFTGKGDYLNEFDLVAGEIKSGLTESRFVPLQATLDVMEIMDTCRAQMGLVYPFER